MNIEVEEFMATGIVSSYMMLVEKKSMDEVLQLQYKYNKECVFFIAPADLRNGRYNEIDLDAMIEYFVITEEYEKCAKLTKIRCRVFGTMCLNKIINDDSPTALAACTYSMERSFNTSPRITRQGPTQ